jgi:hypothetical protein
MVGNARGTKAAAARKPSVKRPKPAPTRTNRGEADDVLSEPAPKRARTSRANATAREADVSPTLDGTCANEGPRCPIASLDDFVLRNIFEVLDAFGREPKSLGKRSLYAVVRVCRRWSVSTHPSLSPPRFTQFRVRLLRGPSCTATFLYHLLRLSPSSWHGYFQEQLRACERRAETQVVGLGVSKWTTPTRSA